MDYVYSSSFTHYKAADINRDGIQELILATNRYNIGYDNRIFILTYYKGTGKAFLCFEAAGARGNFFLTKNVLLATGSSWGSTQFYFSVDKGKIVRKLYVERVNYKPAKEFWYYVNGKKTTKSAWDSACGRYPDQREMKITFSRIP